MKQQKKHERSFPSEAQQQQQQQQVQCGGCAGDVQCGDLSMRESQDFLGPG